MMESDVAAGAAAPEGQNRPANAPETQTCGYPEKQTRGHETPWLDKAGTWWWRDTQWIPPLGCGGAGNKRIGCGVMNVGSGTQVGRRIRAATGMATVAGLTGGTGMKAGVVPRTMDELAKCQVSTALGQCQVSTGLGQVRTAFG